MWYRYIPSFNASNQLKITCDHCQLKTAYDPHCTMTDYLIANVTVISFQCYIVCDTQCEILHSKKTEAGLSKQKDLSWSDKIFFCLEQGWPICLAVGQPLFGK